jgi:hypothetical protein
LTNIAWQTTQPGTSHLSLSPTGITKRGNCFGTCPSVPPVGQIRKFWQMYGTVWKSQPSLNDFDAGARIAAKLFELSPVTGLPSQICLPRPGLSRPTEISYCLSASSISILQAICGGPAAQQAAAAGSSRGGRWPLLASLLGLACAGHHIARAVRARPAQGVYAALRLTRRGWWTRSREEARLSIWLDLWN